jgi:serine protease AprX
MKKSLFLLALSLIIFASSAQNKTTKFRVTFTDKNNSPYSISNPSQYLSQKAIDRRTRMGIAIQANDIPVNSWYIDSVQKTGVAVYTVSKWFNCITIYTTDSTVIPKILSFPFVAGVDSLYKIVSKKSVQQVNSKEKGKSKEREKKKKKHESVSGTQSLETGAISFFDIVQNQIGENSMLNSGNKYDYGLAYTQAHMLGTDYLHNLGFNGQGMTIAVLDAGFYSVDTNKIFDSLWVNHQILGTKDFVQPGGSVFARSTHGMMVLSTMGGNIPGQIVGTAPKASYWLLRTEDADTEFPVEEDNWVAAAEYADSVGADIINSSLGYTIFDNAKWSHTYQDMNGHTARSTKGAVIASSKGLLICNSAGNSGNGTWHYIGAPADADNIITVGSVDATGKVSSFSSRGPAYDGRIKPTLCAMGENTAVASSFGTVQTGSGTSFSSPVMTGSVACLWQANYSKSNLEIINALIASANHYYSPDANFGYGVPAMMAANMILHGSVIDNFDKDEAVNVFPNPISDNFNIVFYSNDTSAVDVQLFDLSGRMAFSKEGISRTPGCNYIPITGIADLTKGYYMLKVFSGKKTYSMKLLKTQ